METQVEVASISDATEVNEDDSASSSLEDAVESLLTPSKREQPVYIDDLPDAIVEIDGLTHFVPSKTGHVIIEKWYNNRWMGTSLYLVRSIDPMTGNLSLHDEENIQSAMANYITGPRDHGWRFKQGDPKLRLDKREAPKQNLPPKVERPVNADGTKKRGRPKGSKNRSPEEISRDRARENAERAAKKNR